MKICVVLVSLFTLYICVAAAEPRSSKNLFKTINNVKRTRSSGNNLIPVSVKPMKPETKIDDGLELVGAGLDAGNIVLNTVDLTQSLYENDKAGTAGTGTVTTTDLTEPLPQNEKQLCFQTKCHVHSVYSWCPIGMITKSWKRCAAFLGKFEECCTPEE